MLIFQIFATYQTHCGNFHLALKEICSSPKVKTSAEWIELGQIPLSSSIILRYSIVKTLAEWLERGKC